MSKAPHVFKTHIAGCFDAATSRQRLLSRLKQNDRRSRFIGLDLRLHEHFWFFAPIRDATPVRKGDASAKDRRAGERVLLIASPEDLAEFLKPMQPNTYQLQPTYAD